MVRDARMLELVSGEREPITPFIVKLPALAARAVSCILVIGGSGQYFDVAGGWRVARRGWCWRSWCVVCVCARERDSGMCVHTCGAGASAGQPPQAGIACWARATLCLPPALPPADTVICMDAYVPSDVTAAALAISARHAGKGDSLPCHTHYGDVTPRTLVSGATAGRAARGAHRAGRAGPCCGTSSAPLAGWLAGGHPGCSCVEAGRRARRACCPRQALVQCTRARWRRTAATCASRPAPCTASSWTTRSWTSGGGPGGW